MDLPPMVSLRAFREARGWTLADLAAAIAEHGFDVDPDALSRNETGGRQGNNEALMSAWAKALGIRRQHIYTPADLADRFTRTVEPLVYPLREVAEMAYLSERYLTDGCAAYRWVHQRQGRHIGMTLAQIDALLAAHQVQAVAADDEAAQLAAARAATAGRLARSRRAAA